MWLIYILVRKRLIFSEVNSHYLMLYTVFEEPDDNINIQNNENLQRNNSSSHTDNLSANKNSQRNSNEQDTNKDLKTNINQQSNSNIQNIVKDSSKILPVLLNNSKLKTLSIDNVDDYKRFKILSMINDSSSLYEFKNRLIRDSELENLNFLDRLEKNFKVARPMSIIEHYTKTIDYKYLERSSKDESLFLVEDYKLYIYVKSGNISIYQADSYNQLIKSLFFEEWNIVEVV